MMKKVLIAFGSRTENTAKMAITILPKGLDFLVMRLM